jgi:hypothetical protein
MRLGAEVSARRSASRRSDTSVALGSNNGNREVEEFIMAEETKFQTGSPTAKASLIALEDFIEVATRAAIRAAESQGVAGQVSTVNPQPLPPGAATTRPGGRIITGIIFEPD